MDESNIGRSYAEIKANPNQIEAVREKIFEDLFTTKAVGKGTGLGLAIARQIIVDTHGGAIAVNSTLGHGTELAIMLPIIQ